MDVNGALSIINVNNIDIKSPEGIMSLTTQLETSKANIDSKIVENNKLNSDLTQNSVSLGELSTNMTATSNQVQGMDSNQVVVFAGTLPSNNPDVAQAMKMTPYVNATPSSIEDDLQVLEDFNSTSI